jgi:aryl-alcohol dehydrogenase-like predicted oxidoreductase
MQQRTFGRLGESSACTLGGGGTGQGWGLTTREEGAAPVHEAVEAGITFFDVAPSYGNGEAQLVIGEAVGGRLPEGVQVATTCRFSFTTRESLMIWPTVTLERPVHLQRRRRTCKTRR